MLEEYADLVIPELENSELRLLHPNWSARDEAILRKYFPTRTPEALAAYFATTDTPRTVGAIISHAHAMKILTEGRKPWKKNQE